MGLPNRPDNRYPPAQPLLRFAAAFRVPALALLPAFFALVVMAIWLAAPTAAGNEPPFPVNIDVSADEVYRGQDLTINANGTDDSMGEANLTPEFEYLVPGTNLYAWKAHLPGSVTAVAISSDGEYIAVGSNDDRVYLFQRDGNTPLWSRATGDHVGTVAISSDGEYIVAGSNDDRVYLFQRDGNTPLWSHATGDHVGTVAISSDGEYIVAGSNDGRVYLFQRDNSTPRWNYTTEDMVASVAISSGGEYIVAGSNDGRGYLFRNDSGIPVWNYTTGDSVRSVAISSGGEYIVAGSNDGRVYLFHNDSGTPVWNYTTGDSVRSVATSSNGGDIVAGSDDGRLYLFHNDSHVPAWNYSTVNPVASVTISADGKHIMAGGYDNRVYHFHSRSSTPLWSYATGNYVITVAISSDGKHMAGGGLDNYVYQFPMESSTSLWDYTATDYISTVSISSDGEYLVSGSGDKRVYLFRKEDPLPLWSYETGGSVYSVAISANGEYLAAGGGDAKVYCFHRNSSTPLWSYTTGSAVYSVAVSANGDFIAVGSYDNRVYLFHRGNGAPLWSYPTGDFIRSVDISSNGEYIVAGGGDRNVYLFHRDDSEPIWSHPTCTFVNTVAISLDGRYIAAGGNDNKVYLFHRENETPLWDYSTGDAVYSVSISANGEFIAAGSWDNKVYLFNRGNSTPLWDYSTGDYVSSVVISSNAEFIAAGGGDDRVYLFRVHSGTPFWSYEAGDNIRDIAFSINGEYIVAGTESDRVHLLLGSYNRTIPNPVYIGDKWSSTYSPPGNASLGNYTFRVRFLDSQGGIGDWRYTLSPVVVLNNPPQTRIDSISPLSTNEGTAVTFNGTAWDADGSLEIAAFTWHSSMDGFIGTSASFIYDGLSPGVHNITFRAQDGDGAWSPGFTATIWVNQRPLAVIVTPTANVVIADEEVTFNGSGVDFDGTIVEYQWRSSLDGPLGNAPMVNIDNLTPGPHTIFFRVRDNDGEWSRETNRSLKVNVRPTAFIDFITPRPSTYNNEVAISGHGIDDEGPVLSYIWTSSIDGNLSYASTFSTYSLSPGNHTISLQVQDADGAWSEEVTDSLFVNLPPIARIRGIDPAHSLEGDSIMFNGTGSDFDGSVTGYHWRSSLDGFLSHNVSFNTASLRAGNHTIYFRVQDDTGAWSLEAFNTLFVNAPPVAEIIGDYSSVFRNNETIILVGTGNDSDGGELEYEWVSSIDGVLSTEPSVTIPAANLTPGTHRVGFRVRDESGVWSTTVNLTIIVEAALETDVGDDTSSWRSRLGIFFLALLIIGGVIVITGLIIIGGVVAATGMTREPAFGGGPRYHVENLVLVHNSGRLLTSIDHEGKVEVDEAKLGDLLTDVKSLIEEVSGESALPAGVTSGNSNVVMVKSDHCYLAAMVDGDPGPEFKPRLEKALYQVETTYRESLAEWNGDALDSVSDYLLPIVSETAEMTPDPSAHRNPGCEEH